MENSLEKINREISDKLRIEYGTRRGSHQLAKLKT